MGTRVPAKTGVPPSFSGSRSINSWPVIEAPLCENPTIRACVCDQGKAAKQRDEEPRRSKMLTMALWGSYSGCTWPPGPGILAPQLSFKFQVPSFKFSGSKSYLQCPIANDGPGQNSVIRVK